MRVLGIDLGSRRIGVAVSDASGTLASPLAVLTRSGDQSADHSALLALAREHGAERLIVGLPLSLSGEVGPAARAALDEAEALADAVGVPVETYDERLTTVQATRSMIAANVRRSARRRTVDQVAAAVMLQAWLDSRAAR